MNIIRIRTEWHPYISFRGCDGRSELGLIYTSSVNGTCFKTLGSPRRVHLGDRGHYPLIDGCSHPVYFSKVSIFSFLKWFSQGQSLKSFPIFLIDGPCTSCFFKGSWNFKEPPIRRLEDRHHTRCVLFLWREAAAHFLTIILTPRIKDSVRFASSRDFRALTV